MSQHNHLHHRFSSCHAGTTSLRVFTQRNHSLMPMASFYFITYNFFSPPFSSNTFSHNIFISVLSSLTTHRQQTRHTTFWIEMFAQRNTSDHVVGIRPTHISNQLVICKYFRITFSLVFYGMSMLFFLLFLIYKPTHSLWCKHFFFLHSRKYFYRIQSTQIRCDSMVIYLITY